MRETAETLPVAAARGGEPTERQSIRAVDRAVRVLTVLADAERPQTLTVIAAAAGLSPATTLRLLRTLQAHDLVQTQADRYLLGFRILQLSQALMRQLDIVEIARPFITAVRDECDETAGIGVRTGDYWVHVVEVEAAQAIRRVSNLSERLPLYAGSTGKVFLAAMPDDELEDYLRRTRLTRLSETTPTDPQLLRQQIEQARVHGYATSHNERGEGGAGVAAPIRAHNGQVIAALTISGPASRFSGERLSSYIDAVLRASRQLSAALGYNRV
jgi:DNA-binding IclR family transcriptional regulator